MQIEDWLINWFVARAKLKGNASENQPETLRQIDYFEAGWLTSMEVVEFVMEIEQKFAMQFSDRDLRDPNFVTIGGLAALILERSTQASEGE